MTFKLWINQLYKINRNHFKNLIFFIIGNLKGRFLFSDKDFLEIGSGENKKVNFINLGYNIKNDIPYNLEWGLPFKNHRLQMIYAEHVLEHFHYRDLKFILKECYRTLKPNGILRIVVPNPDIFIQGYVNPDNFKKEYQCGYNWGLSYSSKLDFLNYVFYMDGEHKYMMDEEILKNLSSEIGFRQSRLSNFTSGLDSLGRERNSIYFELI